MHTSLSNVNCSTLILRDIPGVHERQLTYDELHRAGLGKSLFLGLQCSGNYFHILLPMITSTYITAYIPELVSFPLVVGVCV